MISFFIWESTSTMVGPASVCLDAFDRYTRGIPPSVIVGATALSCLGLKLLGDFLQEQLQTHPTGLMGRGVLLPSSHGNKMGRAQRRAYDEWERLAPLLKDVPQEGLGYRRILEYIELFGKKLFEKGQSHPFSERFSFSSALEELASAELTPFDVLVEPIDGSLLWKKLKQVYTVAFHQVGLYLQDERHAGALSLQAYIEAQIVHMLVSLLGGDPQQVMGVATATEVDSLMLALEGIKQARMPHHCNEEGQGVLIARTGAHAGLAQAAKICHLGVAYVETNALGELDLKALRAAIQRHGKNVIGLIGCVLANSCGVIDPIAEMGEIALEHGCACHVTCALEECAIAHLPQGSAAFLRLPGVTSLSVDMCGNSISEGCSVLLSKNMARDLVYRRAPRALYVLLEMLVMGKKGYERIAKAMLEKRGGS